MKIHTRIISLDPGIRGCGIGIWSTTGLLIDCQYVKNTSPQGNRLTECLTMAEAIHSYLLEKASEKNTEYQFVLVTEWPRVYNRQFKADGNDLLPLTCVAGALAAKLNAVTVSYAPSKEVSHTRISKHLTSAENELLNTKAKGHLGHNVRDAVGIGLFYFEEREIR